MNKDWYEQGGKLYNSSLANEKIAPGETKTLTLVLTKQMTENNTGTVNNLAEIAESYHRDCFAFPGRINDMYSAGCNELIRSNRAVLLQSAEELIKAMNWDSEAQAPAVIQRQLFPELDENEEKIVSLLQKHPDGIQINTLVVESNIAINRMTGILFELEMKGIIRTLAGGVYKLI